MQKGKVLISIALEPLQPLPNSYLEIGCGTEGTEETIFQAQTRLECYEQPR